MINDRRMWVRAVDARPGVELAVGRHVVVSDGDAERRVAQIVTIDDEANIEIVVLLGPVGLHQDLLSRA